jgi:hypothetical protein
MQDHRWVLIVDGEVWGHTSKLPKEEAERLVRLMMPDLEEFELVNYATAGKRRIRAAKRSMLISTETRLYRAISKSDNLG